MSRSRAWFDSGYGSRDHFLGPLLSTGVGVEGGGTRGHCCLERIKSVSRHWLREINVQGELNLRQI
jgi:hypothetical protein